jgi:hypothetical protein
MGESEQEEVQGRAVAQALGSWPWRERGDHVHAACGQRGLQRAETQPAACVELSEGWGGGRASGKQWPLPPKARGGALAPGAQQKGCDWYKHGPSFA